MIHSEELDRVLNTMAHAMDLARQQLWADGLCELAYGSRRAEVIQNDALQMDTSAPWLAELETHWRLAIDRYCEENGPR